MTMTFGAGAQGTDSFITNMKYEDNFVREVVLPMLPVWGVGVFDDDAPATSPLGSGLLVLTALGAGYAVRKRRKK